MDTLNYLKDMFDSTRDWKNIALWMFLFDNFVELLYKCGFWNHDINHVCWEF